MSILQDIQKKYSDGTSKLADDCEMFFAFTDKQFDDGLAKVRADNKERRLIKLGAGCFIPADKIDRYNDGIQDLKDTFANTLSHHNLHDDYIAYQLANHEAFYTYEIEDAWGAMIVPYTREKVLEVFNKVKQYHYND